LLKRLSCGVFELSDLVEDILSCNLAAANGEDTRFGRFRHGQREPSGLCVFAALVGEPEGMHAIFHVPAVGGDELGTIDPYLTAASAEAFALIVHVAEELGHGPPAGERWRQVLELLTEWCLHEEMLARDEEQEQDGGIAGGGQASVLAERVGGEIKVAGAGAGAFWLGAVDPVFESDEAERGFGRFDRDRHLVAVILALDHEAVDRGADQAADDAPLLRDRSAVGIGQRAFRRGPADPDLPLV